MPIIFLVPLAFWPSSDDCADSARAQRVEHSTTSCDSPYRRGPGGCGAKTFVLAAGALEGSPVFTAVAS